MNPYKDVKALQVATDFYQKYYADQKERTVLFGINPGRFGGGVTGVPFTDPIRLEQDCGIVNPFDKKPELSSGFIYEMITAFGGPKAFYQRFYISAISPLGFVKAGKNLNYYDIENWKGLFEEYAVQRIREQLHFPLGRKVAFSIGQGENLKFLTRLNQKYELFDEIQMLPHPRWVMQYRLKQKARFIDQYLQTLSGVDAQK